VVKSGSDLHKLLKLGLG
jgi:hypothetical protein